MTDPLDLPEDGADEYGLVYPFVACLSQGGPYDDDAFVAGVQLGRIDHALVVAEAIDARELRFTVRADLVKQLELCGMARGFPTITAEQVEASDDHDAMPEWSYITFARGVMP